MTFPFDEDDDWGDAEELEQGRASKSAAKRDCDHLSDVVDDILKMTVEDRRSLALPDSIDAAIELALKIKSRSGSKRQRRYISKLMRSADSEAIEASVKQIQHRHDTSTAQFKRLEAWRDRLVDGDKQALNEVIDHYPEVDRQHINQLIRAAHKEKQQEKPPAAARKLFKYLRDLQQDAAG